MIKIKDQMGNNVVVDRPPSRIISLVPSITKTLYDLGCGDRIVGVTKFCVHPQAHTQLCAKIGGTKNPNLAKIEKLKPDFIIANKEENRVEDIMFLKKYCPIYVSDIKNIHDTIEMMINLSVIIDIEISDQINALQKIQDTKIEIPPLKAFYLIWKEPYMTIGQDTYIHAIMQHFGLENVFGARVRYPITDVDELSSHNVDVVLLSSEPYPFKECHIKELEDVLPPTTIILVDGEAFSWYGTMLLDKYEYLTDLHQKITDTKYEK